MSGPLLSGYRFLASHGRAPGPPESAGILTLVVNSCMLTFGLLALGLGLSLSFLVLAVRDRRLWVNTFKALAIVLFAWRFLSSTEPLTGDFQYDRVVGVLFLAALFCLVTPISRWIKEHSRGASIVCGAVVIGAMLVRPDWMKNWWTSGGNSEYQLIPLSQLGLMDWAAALMGAAVYVYAYGGFQQWRTKGKWLEELKQRIGWDELRSKFFKPVG